MSRRDLTITKLERDEKSFWKCNITTGGKTLLAHRKSGSWMLEDKDGLRELLPEIAALVQEKVRPLEKKERLAREKS
jgi:hypothetical protein